MGYRDSKSERPMKCVVGCSLLECKKREDFRVFIGWVAGTGFVGFEWSVGNGEMVGVDVLFSFEFECGHRQFLFDLSVLCKFVHSFSCSSGSKAWDAF